MNMKETPVPVSYRMRPGCSRRCRHGSSPVTDRRVIAALCVVGALRIFVFSAAFPPFHSSDEHFHFDLVVKYAHGHVPYRLADERLSAETRDAIVLYGTGISR